jgi:hypothetical protein
MVATNSQNDPKNFGECSQLKYSNIKRLSTKLEVCQNFEFLGT